MATDYGGTHGSQPWHDGQPPYPGRPYPGQPPYGQPQQPHGRQPDQQQPPYGQPPYGQPPYGQPPYGQPGRPAPGGPPYGQPSYGPPGAPPPYGGSLFPEPPRWEPARGSGPRPPLHRRRLVAAGVIVLGVIVLVLAAFGATDQGGPRKFTAKEVKQITDWEYGKRWRTLPAGTIFPASVTYPPPVSLDDDPSLTLTAHRVGIGEEGSCASAADQAAAAVLDRDGCSAMLRATYVDETGSFVVTVGAAALPTSASAQSAAKAINDASKSSLGPTVHALKFTGTPAGQFTDKQRQLSEAEARGTYVVLYTVGYADSRSQQQVSQDPYANGEMTNVGRGVADDVLSVLAAPVPVPHCPDAGMPGC